MRRYSTIKYLWVNGIIDRVQGKDFLAEQVNFISDFYLRDPLNRFRENVAGWQVFSRFSAESINWYPFKALLRIQGAYPRLVALERCEALSSHPDLIKIEHLDKVVGCYSRFMKEEKGNNIIAKGLFILYIGKFQGWFDSKWTIENKIKLTEYVQRAIHRIKSVLKPVLSFRYLVEEKVRELQGK